jgi:hypothetical protein
MELDCRDLALAMFADAEVRLLERIVSLTADVEAYRALARESIHLNAQLIKERDSQHRALSAARHTLRAERRMA